jgi:dipeptidyl-peptidase-4
MQIDLYDFCYFKKLATLIDTKDHKGFLQLMGYTLMLLKNDALACNSNQIFRHSFTADYYLYQIDERVD